MWGDGSQRRDFFLLLDLEPFDLEDEEVPFAGIFSVFPARIASPVMPFAFLSSSMVTPYFLEMEDRDSPDLMRWSVVLGVAVALAFPEDLDEACFCEELPRVLRLSA